jgi:hypothetical protein
MAVVRSPVLAEPPTTEVDDGPPPQAARVAVIPAAAPSSPVYRNRSRRVNAELSGRSFFKAASKAGSGTSREWIGDVLCSTSDVA